MVKALLGVLLLLTTGGSVNFFSLKQDIEIGSESAKQAEESLSLVRDQNLDSYFQTIGERLVQDRSLPALRYRFRIVNSKEMNSLGFPGGSIYIYRGLLQIASNDDELAAIIAHEIGHVASRHGTAQLTRQLIVQAPIAIAAGLTETEAWKEQLGKLGISLGIDAPFLRYSRDQELEAGLMAVRLMAGAHFDPNAFRTLLEKVNEAATGEAPRAPAFVFNHPQSETVAPEIDEEIERVSTTPHRPHVSLEFRTFQTSLQHTTYPSAKTATTDPESDAISRVFTHPQEFYRLGYPDGWVVTRTGPNGAIIAPIDGVQTSRNGDDVTHGVMFDLFDIALPDRSLTLEQATNRLMVFLKQRNQSLRIVPGAQTQTLVSDEPGMRSVVMFGKDDSTDSSQVAWIVTRLYYQSLFFMVFVAPEDEFAMDQPVFEQMIRSVRLR